jgi:predicted AAA+ superfamily ATPase
MGLAGSSGSVSRLLTARRGYSLSRLRADRTVFGALLESFVFSELLKLSAWTEERVMLFRYRDRVQLEVDFILENSAGEIVMDGPEPTAAKRPLAP